MCWDNEKNKTSRLYIHSTHLKNILETIKKLLNRGSSVMKTVKFDIYFAIRGHSVDRHI